MKYIVLFIFLCCYFFSFSQVAPPNDLCQDAIEIFVNDEADKNNIFDLTGSLGIDPDVNFDPLCDPSAGMSPIKDVWFKVEVPASGLVFIDVDDDYFNQGIFTSTVDPRFEAYTGPCNSLQPISDLNGECHWYNFYGLHYTGTPGEFIYVRVFDEDNDDEDMFAISALHINESLNDDCTKAIDIPVGTDCLVNNYATNFSTSLWYKFTVPASGDPVSVGITRVVRNASGNGSVTAYANSCGNLVQITTTNTAIFGVFVANRTPGEVIYIKVNRFTSSAGIPFGFCVFTKENNFCQGALDIPVGTSCNKTYFHTIGSTASNQPTSNINCGSESGRDAWLKSTVPASGNLTIELSNTSVCPGSSWPTAFEFYSGICSNLSAIYCDGNQFGASNNTRVIPFTNLVPGSELYIRVIYAYALEEFEVCAYEAASYPPVCRINTIIFGLQEACDPITNTYIQHFEVDYTVPAGSSVDLYLEGDIYPLTNNPQSLTMELPALGQTFTHQNTRLVGTCTSQFVNHFRAFTTPTSCFNGTIANDDCIGAIELFPTTNCSNNQVYTFIEPTVSANVPPFDFTCSNSQEKDIWFKFTISTTNDFSIFVDRIAGTSFFPYLDLYVGSCMNLTPINNPNCDRGNQNEPISLTNYPIGTTIYARMINCCSNTQGEYKICLSESCASILNINTSISSGTHVYKADQIIYADNDISNTADVVYQATQFIELESGFSVTPAATFEVNFNGCN